MSKKLHPAINKLREKFGKPAIPDGAGEKQPVQAASSHQGVDAAVVEQDVPRESVKFSCGHEREVASLAALRCPKCAGDERTAKAARYMRRKDVTHRLPHGSRFDVWYDAEAARWRGKLELNDGKVYEDESSGVFKLLSKLDDRWQADQVK